MFSSYFSALLLSAACVSALPELQLKVLGTTYFLHTSLNINFTSGAAKVEGAQNFWVSTLVKNTGDEPLRILNDPRGPLSLVPTNTFTITDADGQNPHFTGVKIKYSKRAVVDAGRDESFTDLAPGQSFKLVHNRESPLANSSVLYI
jgi:peptidyl-Lys metalloendopeptidase